MHETDRGYYGEHLRFLDPVNGSGSKQFSRRIADLDYLDLHIAADYGTCDDGIESIEREFHSKRQIMEVSADCASPSWTTAPRDAICEESPLLPYYRHCRYLPSQKGVEAAADARRALMELIQRMPESSYELSFNVYIKEQQSMEESQEAIMEEKMDCKTKSKIEQKNKNTRLKVLTRSESDNSANFLLKVSLPVFLGSKKKPIGSSLSLPRDPLRKGSEKPAKKAWWKMLCAETSEASIRDIDQSSNSTSSSNGTNGSSTRWLSESNLIPGRGYSSSRKFRGCLF